MPTEAERIEAMRAAGTISDAEAERLLAVLRDLGEVPPATDPGAPVPPAPRPTDAAERGAVATPPVPPAPPVRPERPAPPRPPRPDRERDREAWRELREQVRRVGREARDEVREAMRDARAGEVARDVQEAAREVADKVRTGVEQLRASIAGSAAAATADAAPSPAAATAPVDLAPDGTRWLEVDVPAGDLELIAADVDAPQLDERDTDDAVRLEPSDAGATLRVDGSRGVFGRIRPVDVKVRVPRAWGVALDVKAGDLEVRGVPFVRGRVLAGDVEVRDAVGLDLECLAGDLSVTMRPTQGSHRLVARAGDVGVTLLRGSDATVTGRVSMGDASVRGLARERRGLGAAISGSVGAGTARVSIELGAGDLEVRAQGSEG